MEKLNLNGLKNISIKMFTEWYSMGFNSGYAYIIRCEFTCQTPFSSQ